MVCKNITITGLEDIEADDIITDTISVLSSLYVSGNTNFNNISVNSSLVVSGNNVLNSLDFLITGVSSLTNLRADNIYTMISQEQTTISTLVNGVYPTSEIKFLVNTGSNNLISTQSTCFTKIDTDGELNVFHILSEFLPTRNEGWWVVHDELAQAQRDSIGLRFDVTNLQAGSLLTDAAVATLQSDVATAQATATLGVLNAGLAQATATGAAISISSFSAQAQLLINDLNVTSTTIFNNLNSFSTAAQLSINNLNVTSTSIFNNLNSFSTSAQLSINNLNATSTTIFNKTLFSELYVVGGSTFQGATTCLSTLNISGASLLNDNVTMNNNLIINGNWLNIRGPSCGLGIGTSLSALGMASISNAYSTSALTGDTILRSEANLILQSGVANGALIIDTSNNTLINGNITIKSNLNVSGGSIFQNTMTLKNTLNVSGGSIFQNTMTIKNTLNVSGGSIFENTMTLNNTLNVSGGSIFENTMTLNNTLNVSGSSIFQNDMLINARLTARNVSNKSCFYFRCSATGTNFGGQTWYTYDIDLRKYTKIYDMSPASILRKFTIKTWLRTGNFYYNFGEILENEYSIYMNHMYTYEGGLKVRSFSHVPNNFNNYYLDQLNGTQILLNSGDINYIKYLSNVANTVVSCIIQDEL